jgi:hypothetical protein
MNSMDELSQEDKSEYEGMRDCQEGHACKPGMNDAYYRGYSLAYTTEQRETARSLANGY